MTSRLIDDPWRHPRTGKPSRWLAAAVLVASVTACATPPPADDQEAVEAFNEANDPIEPLNRYFFEVNLGLDRLFLRPAAEIYRGTLPTPVRDGVRNFLVNLRSPVIFANDVFQGETERAGQTFGRFATNTFVGVGGIFDVAAGDNPDIEGGIPFHDEDFGQTLGVYDVSEGPYLVLPILGPSNPRDATGLVVDSFLDPLSYVTSTGVSIARFGVEGLDRRSRNIETLDEIERTSIDYYATVRSLYRQFRRSQILNDNADETPIPEISIEYEDDDEQERVSAKTE